MTADPATLLTALVDACRLGRVSHYEAATMLNIRKEDVGDLVAWRMIEVALWRVYLSAFYNAFPECSPRLFYRPGRFEPPREKSWPAPAPCITYTGGDAAALPASQQHLDDRISNAACEFAEPTFDDSWENSIQTFAPRESRALPA